MPGGLKSGKSRPGKASSKGLPDLPEIKLDWQDIPLRIRVWWAGASRKKRLWTVFAIFLLVFTFFRLAGCSGPASQDSQMRAAGEKDTAALLDQAKQALSSKSVVYSRSGFLGSDVWYGRDGNRLLISTPDGQSLVSGQGERLKSTSGECWRSAGRSPIPSPSAVVLPLSEPSAVFAEPDNQEGLTYLAFSSDRLGSWGAGAGSLVLDNGSLPVGFTYTLQGQSDEYRFDISYPKDFPEPKVKRC